MLLLFNKQDIYTFKEILQLIQISEKQLFEQIQPLIDIKILKREDESKKINIEDRFLINLDFQDKNYRVRIPAQKKKDISQKQKDKTKERAMFERKYIIESKIMQILKSEKTISYNSLLFKIQQQSKVINFEISVPLLKKCIEELIQKDYLKRTNDKKGFVFQP